MSHYAVRLREGGWFTLTTTGNGAWVFSREVSEAYRYVVRRNAQSMADALPVAADVVEVP